MAHQFYLSITVWFIDTSGLYLLHEGNMLAHTPYISCHLLDPGLPEKNNHKVHAIVLESTWYFISILGDIFVRF